MRVSGARVFGPTRSATTLDSRNRDAGRCAMRGGELSMPAMRWRSATLVGERNPVARSGYIVLRKEVHMQNHVHDRASFLRAAGGAALAGVSLAGPSSARAARAA